MAQSRFKIFDVQEFGAKQSPYRSDRVGALKEVAVATNSFLIAQFKDLLGAPLHLLP